MGILILFFNKLLETNECINSYLPSEENIYILNNGSESELWHKLQRKYVAHKQVHFIHSPKNLGPAKGRNLLIENTEEEWLFFVDNDITIKSPNDWVNEFRKFTKQNPAAEIICPKLFNIHENELVHHPLFHIKDNVVSLDYKNAAVTNYFPSGASIVKRSVFDKYGLFEEDIFAFEDYEYAIRVLCKTGELQAYVCNNITLFHDHRYQVSRTDKEAVKKRYKEERLRNSFNFIQQKHCVIFDHDWKWWSKKQVTDMTGNPFLKKIKNGIKCLLRC